MRCWWSPVKLNQTTMFLSERLQFKKEKKKFGGKGGEVEGSKTAKLWLINFTDRVKMDPVGFDLILMGTGFFNLRIAGR